jgi:quinol monooxygenase YgiN
MNGDHNMPASTPQAPHLSVPTRIGDEISITGKWVPAKPGGRFRTSEESREMLQEWEAIHQSARADTGVLSTEINHAVGEDAVLVHHVFENADALVDYFATTATEHMGPLTSVAKPDLHMVRGLAVPASVSDAVRDKAATAAFGEHVFGFVKHDYRLPDPATAINVTAKWTTKSGTANELDELIHWWQQVATDAYDLEEGMVRFEAYRVIGEDALIIHEVFDSTAELKFHLTKGTADRYKKYLDQIAEPERYFFRGPVSWTIRTYSKFMHLPATYSSQGSHFTRGSGSMSDGII